MNSNFLLLAQMNAQLVVSAQDLQDFALDLYYKGRADVEREKASEQQRKDDEFYTREQAARILHVSVRTIDNMRQRGFFGENARKGLDKVGNRVLIPKSRISMLIK